MPPSLDPESSPADGLGNSEVYLEALRHLPLTYRDRLNVATVAGYLAVHGRNVTRIAQLMGRDRKWVRARITAAERLFRPALSGYGPRDLTGN